MITSSSMSSSSLPPISTYIQYKNLAFLNQKYQRLSYSFGFRGSIMDYSIKCQCGLHFKIIKIKGLLHLAMKCHRQIFADVSSQEEEHQDNLYQTESINEDDKYMKSFDGQHLNYFLSLRKKQDSKAGTEEDLPLLEPIALNKMHSASEQRDKLAEFDEQKDNSLIFRPKNKRKIQQNAAKCEQSSNKIGENGLFSNPQKGKRKGKLLTRRSEEYQPEFHWFQPQNPANQTLPS